MSESLNLCLFYFSIPISLYLNHQGGNDHDKALLIVILITNSNTIIQVCVRQYAVNGDSELLASDWPSQFSFFFSLFNARAVKIKQPRCVG